MLKRFMPLLVAACVGAGVYHAVTHQVLHVYGWQQYLDQDLRTQLADRDKACNGIATLDITVGPFTTGRFNLGANKTSCEMFAALSKDQQGVVQMAQAPKPPTVLAALWAASQHQPSSPLLAVGSKPREGSDCDTGHVRVPSRFKSVVCDSARRHGIDAALLAAQIRQESSFRTDRVSIAGAIGIAQIMPSTARGWGVDPTDPIASIDAMAKHMASYKRTYQRQGHSSDTAHMYALAAYNAGPKRVAQYGGIPPYRETRNYVARIWQAFKRKV